MAAVDRRGPLVSSPAARLAGGHRRRLLIVDDELDSAELVARIFDDRFEVHLASDGRSGLEVARRISPDVIIADQQMPHLTGVEFLAIAEQELPHTLRILVSAFTDYGSVVKAVNLAHVHHYVEKPYHPADLVAVVVSLARARELERERDELLGRVTKTVQDLDRANLLLAETEAHLQKLVIERTQQLTRANEELRRANELLRQLAVRDGLTGLFNHRYLMEHLDIEVARAERYERAFGVVYVDIDELKHVNDRFGAATGDEVLVRTARLVQSDGSALRRSDFAARYGGDEFMLLLSETDVDGALLKAERIRRSVEAEDWEPLTPGLARPITVSVGVACYPGAGESGRDLIEAADAALFVAKRQGRNRVCCAPGVRAGAEVS